MHKNLIRRGISLVVGLCLFLPLLTSTVVSAEELKPFLTIKSTGPATLLKIAEKVAELSGTTDDFQAAVGPHKDLKGLNAESPLVFVLRSDGDEIKEPILYVPIDDLDAVNLPGFDMIKSSLKKDGDLYQLNSPLGVFEVRQTKGYYVVSPQGSEGDIPETPTAFIVGMEKYALAFKVDFEHTSFEAIEMFLAPLQMLMAMQGPEAAQAIENLNEQIERAHEELQTMTFGIDFDPKTSALEFSGSFRAKAETDTAEQIARFNELKTSFAGFLGDQNIIFSLNTVEMITELNREAAVNALDPLFDGILEQVEINAEEDDDVELAEAIVDSLKKVIGATLEKEKCDYALSFDAEGTLLGALTVGDTAELKEITKQLRGKVRTMHDADAFDTFMKANLKKDYLTVEGFKVSSLTVPLSEAAEAHDIPEALQDKTIALFWAVKDDEAIAFASGLNAEKTEATFKKALEATKTPVALKQPTIVFALQPLGQLLKNVDFDKVDAEAAKVVRLLAGAGSEAKMTVSAEVVDGTMSFKCLVDGQVIQTLAEIIKSISPQGGALNRSDIKDF